MSTVPWPQLEAIVAAMTDQERQRLLRILAQFVGQRDSGRLTPRPSADGFEAELAEVAFDAPPLPADFSRADIYLDHD
jgi:hypothetical protein